MKPAAFWGVTKSAASGWSADNCSSMGAAVAFYSLLSMAPLLMLVITIAGLVIGHDRAQELLMTQMAGLLGDTGAEGVKTMLAASATHKDGLVATISSAAVLALGATTIFAELQSDLNRIWKCDGARSSGVWGLIRARLLSFGLIAVIGLLLLTSLVVSAGVSYLADAWLSGFGAAVAHVLELAASVLITTALFALTFKILPARRIPWGDVLLGSLITAVLFAIGKYLIGLYLGKSAVASSFGAAGTIVVAIVWVYYSAQIFFFGAEFTRAYSHEHGSKRFVRAANSDFGSEAAMVERARRIVKGSDPVVRQGQG
jgi:membrane protein